MTSIDPVTLEVLRNACVAIAEEMNATLVRTSYSPNIKDRRDCSCALFDLRPDDRAPEMISQAENQPVHLGAMPASVAAALDRFPQNTLEPEDAILLNDPYHGGAHLPDLTLVSPIFSDGRPVALAANRAHHADVGGSRAGSVAADSTEIYQEGVRIPPIKLVENGLLNEAVMDVLLTNVRTPDERRGDLRAQRAANQTGRQRFEDLVDRYGLELLESAMAEIKAYSERRMRAELENMPDGQYTFSDVLDDDGRGTEDIRIAVEVIVDRDEVEVDFAGTADQVAGAINAPLAVTESATYYALRCVTDPDIPANEGCYRPIDIHAPSGSVVNAKPPAAVVGGNLEVSQRVTDVVLGAFADSAPERVLAGCQGTMNNVTFGGIDPRGDESAFALYETIGGGFGGRVGGDGLDGVHVHMSNTLNTPAEVIETAYPLRVQRYQLRPDTGGAGEYRGGLGLRRDIEVRTESRFSLLADRRSHRPYGIKGGEEGAAGEDFILRNGREEPIQAKSTHDLEVGDVVSIRTPGAGGYGLPEDRDHEAIHIDLRLGKISTEALGDYGLTLEDLEGIEAD